MTKEKSNKPNTTESIGDARAKWKDKAKHERNAAKKSRRWAIGQGLAFGLGVVAGVAALGLLVSPFSVFGIGLGSVSLSLLGVGGSFSAVGMILGGLAALFVAKVSGLTSKISHNNHEATRHNKEAGKASRQAKTLAVEQEKMEEAARQKEITELKAQTEAAIKQEKEAKDIVMLAQKEAQKVTAPKTTLNASSTDAPPVPVLAH